MKSLFLAALFTLSSAAFAISDSVLESRCEQAAQEKLEITALEDDCLLITESLRSTEVENRLMSSVKYVAWEAKAQCGNNQRMFRVSTKYTALKASCKAGVVMIGY